MKVSVLLLTYNEEKNLPLCLDALSWCDDIVVVDSGSSDRTIEIAQTAGARILTRPFDTFADQRNHGLQFGDFRHDWVLHLDADEIVTPEFEASLDALEPTEGIDAYQVPSKMMFLGRWLKHAGMWPVYQVRLGHKDRLRFIQVGHGQREAIPPTRIGMFHEPYLHYSFSHGLAAWLRKHVRYADDEARLIVSSRYEADMEMAAVADGSDASFKRRRLKRLANRLPLFFRPPARFFYIYIIRQGFRDGTRGLTYAFMLSIYESMISLISYEQIWIRKNRNITSG
jgi:glycosyltransferase involved in cell wall biosynthesis